MSVDYGLEVYSDARSTLKINFTGIRNSETDTESLGLAVFAFDTKSGEAIFNGNLKYAQIRDLYDHLNQISIIRDGTKISSGKFVETDEDVVDLINKIDDIGGNALASILSALDSDERISELLKVLSETELRSISAAQKHAKYKRAYDDLLELLDLEKKGEIVNSIKDKEYLSIYVAAQPEKIFQNWIENNLWVFGVEYSKKHNARKIALFSEADILMESLDGYLDLIELKRPGINYKLFNYDDSHNCYYPSKQLSEVIGQSLFYLQKMDDMKLVLEKEHKVKIIQPRIKIIVGRTNDFEQEQYNALRMLNSNLNHIQICSYDYILSSASKVLSSFED